MRDDRRIGARRGACAIGLAVLLGGCLALSGCASMIGGKRVAVAREPAQEVVHVTSNPPGAHVLIGERWLGVTPLTVALGYERTTKTEYKDFSGWGYLLDVLWIPVYGAGIVLLIFDASEDGDLVGVRHGSAPGTHLLRFERDGYKDVARQVTVPGPSEIHVEMVPARAPPPPVARRPAGANPLAGPDGGPEPGGLLRVTSEPPGLLIAIDGIEAPLARVRRTPVREVLPPGRYRVTLTEGTGAGTERVVLVREGGAFDLDLRP